MRQRDVPATFQQKASVFDKKALPNFYERSKKSMLLVTEHSFLKLPCLYLSHDLFDTAECTQITHDQTVKRIESLEALSAYLSSDACSHALIGYPNPELTVMELLKTEKSLPEALSSWAKAAEKLIKLCRQHRSQIVVFDLHAAGNNPDIFVKILSSEIKNTNTFDSALLSVTKTSTVAGIHQLIVREALMQSSLTAPYLQEINATGLNLGAAYDLDTTAMLASKSEEADSKIIIELREDKELLMQQLHQVQEELESYYSTAQKGSELQREIIILQRDLTKRNADLSAVQTSMSWRVTAPARWIMSIFMGKSGIGD